MSKTEKKELALVNGSFNFEVLAKNAQALVEDQALINEENPEKLTLVDIEVKKAKSGSFIEGLSNLIGMSHHFELLSADKNKFSRTQELDALQTLFSAFTKYAEECEADAEYIVKNKSLIREAIDNGENVPIEEFTASAEAKSKAIDNLMKITSGMQRIIQLERFSGGRPYGTIQTKAARLNINQGGGGEEDDGDKKKPRRLSKEEMLEMIENNEH